MKAKTLGIITFFSILITGCAQETVNIDVMHDQGKPVMALDYRDFDQAASQLVQSMLASGALKKEGGGRYIIAKGRIINDTMQRIDTDQLMAKIEIEILRSGQAVMTRAVGTDADELIHQARELRDDEEFDQSTIPERGTLQAFNFSIKGKIFQRNIRYDKNLQQVEYYFQLMLSDSVTGLTYWQDEVIVGKRGSNKSVAW
jgi:uncharacterized protein (TIGR02722 family)